MTFKDYLVHYGSAWELLKFSAVSLAVVFVMHAVLLLTARMGAEGETPRERRASFLSRYGRMSESYYELMFSSTAMLFFTGVYFLISFNYFDLSGNAWEVWSEYEDFILLGFIVLSILFINLMDHFLVPLGSISPEEMSTLRLAGMLYMFVIFAYIKFIYLDDNYNTIVLYFLTMAIGRFVYFDASLKDFWHAIRELWSVLPVLLMVLATTAVLAAYGFYSGYLLKSNGVVVSLFLAHFLVILQIMVISGIRLAVKICR